MRPSADVAIGARDVPRQATRAIGDGTGGPERLVDWLGVFARPYRPSLAIMVGLNLLSAVATFIELELLRALTVVLSRAPAPAQGACTVAAWARSGFSIAPAPCGAQLPFLLLATYVLVVVAQGGLDYAGLAANARLTQAARRDVERELLRNLLRQDDAFFLRRAPSEIISRLGGDLQRVGGRRQMVTQAIATAFSVVAVVWVLAMQSPVAALVGVLVSFVGVLASQPLLGRLRGLDAAAIEADDRVKAGLEDTLGGVAEIQVSGLAPKMLAAFAARQAVRDTLALRNADLTNLNGATQKLTFSFGFIAVLLLFVATELFGPFDAAAGSLDRAALIVLLVSSLPQLYFKLGELTQILSHFQVSGMAFERLSQYQAPGRAGPSVPAARAPRGVALRGVRYRFGAGAPLAGGPQGITCDIPERGLTGIVGPSGAGKSTLLRLVLGRQEPVEGTIIGGVAGADGDRRFVYLPQRPVVFDGTLRENLLLAVPDGAAPMPSRSPRLAALGLTDLVRRKGLDAFPSPDAAGPEGLAAARTALRSRLGAALGEEIRPFGRGAAPRQLVVEAQLGLAVDQAALARRLVSPLAREPVRRLAGSPYGAAMAALGLSVVRRTAPLLAQAATPDDYDRVATVRIEPEVWQLRSRAVELATAPPDGSKTHPLLVAIGLSTRIEEAEDAWPREAPREAVADLSRLVDGLASPLDPDRLNPRLTWRENLVFGAAAGGNANRVAAADRVILDWLDGSPFDDVVLASGDAFRVGRAGGRLSGGQQQLVALGRALLSDAPVMVLDEPSSALHPGLRTDLIGVLQAEAQTRAVLVVTHDMDLARACDRLIFVRDGTVAAEGSWSELVDRDPAFRAWVGSPEAAP